MLRNAGPRCSNVRLGPHTNALHYSTGALPVRQPALRLRRGRSVVFDLHWLATFQRGLVRDNARRGISDRFPNIHCRMAILKDCAGELVDDKGVRTTVAALHAQ